MRRRDFLGGSAFTALGPEIAPAEVAPPAEWWKSPVLAAPGDPALWPAYRQSLTRWREEARRKLNYDGALYSRPDFAWGRSCFACCFIMMCDEQFYSLEEGRYLAEAWVAEGVREFGGYDSVVLWHAYPRIGLDQRNQFDFYRDMPGGLAGVREMSREFQAQGVRVFINYNPWDTGTRRKGVSDLEGVVSMVEALGADGIFLDTMSHGAAGFRARLDAVRPGVVLESELALPLENVHDHHMSWAQGFNDSPVPGVLRNKWFERRHMQHQIKRWNHDHSGELQAAWMNGGGVMVWENVFGSWAGWSPRDRSILRAMLPIQRRYAGLFSGEGWTPLVPAAMPDIYASLWEGASVRLWTLVNRAEEQRDGVLLRAPHVDGERYFDLIGGREIPAAPREGFVSLAAAVRPRGIACFLATAGSDTGGGLDAFLSSQAALDARADFSPQVPGRQVTLRPAPAARRASPPEGMAAIGPAVLEMVTEYRVRETGFYTGQEYVPGRGYQPESGARMFQTGRVTRRVSLGRYAIDLTPVTNVQFAGFLKRSGYQPRHPENFLKHWSAGAPGAGAGDHPVVYVDLDDARAYAAWAGKRLPTEEEWQYAAEGPNAFRYPWGNAIRPGVCNAGETGGATPVKAFPGGRSPFGCYDMCGNAWEWTESERSDGRTRFAMIRGGSYWEARGSLWYMDGGPQPANFAAKVLLMWPGLDRCATVGFRCAADLG
jgi:formylglycine-generating enzyme required for sulfatase activity